MIQWNQLPNQSEQELFFLFVLLEWFIPLRLRKTFTQQKRGRNLAVSLGAIKYKVLVVVFFTQKMPTNYDKKSRLGF